MRIEKFVWKISIWYQIDGQKVQHFKLNMAPSTICPKTLSTIKHGWRLSRHGWRKARQPYNTRQPSLFLSLRARYEKGNEDDCGSPSGKTHWTNNADSEIGGNFYGWSEVDFPNFSVFHGVHWNWGWGCIPNPESRTSVWRSPAVFLTDLICY